MSRSTTALFTNSLVSLGCGGLTPPYSVYFWWLGEGSWNLSSMQLKSLVCRRCLLHPSPPSDSFSMPLTSNAKAGAKKRPAAKGLALKEAAAKLSAHNKAPSRKRVTRDNENHHPVMDTPSSGASVPTSSQTAVATAQDQESEMVNLRSEYLFLFFHMSPINLFF